MARLQALVLFLLAATVAAQPTGGTLHGVLTDNSGAVIPSAVVSIAGAGGQKTASTRVDGNFSLTGLVPGEYTVKVAYPGFGPFERKVTIADGKTTELPVQLLVVAEKQQVTVQGTPGPAVSVDPDNNATAMVVKGSDLDALPDNPDDLNDALQALAGPGAGPNGGELFVDGFSGGKLPPKSSIREIRINQNPFSAEYDRLGMGRIEILTKPGTEKFRGEFSVSDSDGIFNSRNPYADNKTDYTNRYFEGNVGGPLGHRASFFFDIGQRTINNDALINSVTLDPATLLASPVKSSVLTPSSGIDLEPRIDFQLSKNHTLTGRYEFDTSSRDQNGIGQYSLLSRGYSTDDTEHGVRLTETGILSPQAVNETRFGYYRSRTNQYGDNSIPALTVSDAFIGGGSQVGRAYNLSTSLEFQNNTSIGHKTHTIRFGIRVRRRTLADNSPANFGGTFTFFGADNAPVLDANNQPIPGQTTSISSLEQYRRTLLFQKLAYSGALIRSLGGGASQFSIAGGNPLADVSMVDAGLFVQDDWRLRPNFTLSYGLRYENQTNIHDWRDLAPRLGFAWAPGKAPKSGSRKTVLRWGFGTYYDRVNQNLVLQQQRFNGVTQQQYVVINPDFFPSIPSLDTLGAQKQSLSTYQLDRNLRSPLQLQGVVSVERQLPAKTTVAATFMGLHVTHVLRSVNINAPLPGTYDPTVPGSGVRPDPRVGNLFQYESNGVMNQKMFMVSVNTRFSSKVSFNGNYQYMRANSDVDGLASPSDPYNFKEDYGRANFERRNRAQLVGSWLAPFKIRVNPFLNIFGAAPYNLTLGRDLNGDTISNERPAFATDLSRPSVVFTRFGAFDTRPMPGQKLVPRNYLSGDPMINVLVRVGRTFEIARAKEAKGAAVDQGFRLGSASLVAQAPTGNGAEGRHYTLNFSVFCNNPLNHLNKGGWVGNLSSPLFGQSTSIYLQRDTSNNRRFDFSMTFGF